jgi:predicted DNA-binding transcriptional regulator AlpA
MQNSNSSEPLLNRKEAAHYLGVTPGTMAVWDCTKRYDLKPLKVGRAVRYRRSFLDKFLEDQLKK